VNEVNPSDSLLDQLMKLLNRSRRVRKQCDETNAEIQVLSAEIGHSPAADLPGEKNAGPPID